MYRQAAHEFCVIKDDFGLHPWVAHEASADWFDSLRRHLDAVPSAVGEIGLDRWIANPDLVQRMKKGQPLNAPDMGTFFTPGAKGYTDYALAAA